MNKYEESYQRLTNRVYKNDHIEDVYKDLVVLGELVAKATPKKPYYDPEIKRERCPECGCALEPTRYCPECGQKL